jgi:hypothetical protein
MSRTKYPPKKKPKTIPTANPNPNDLQAQATLNAFLANFKPQGPPPDSASSSAPPNPNPNPAMMMEQDTEVDLFPSGSGAGAGASANNNDTASTSDASTHPHTPPHNDLNAAAPGELSPPRSQGPSASSPGESAFAMPLHNGNGNANVKGKEQAVEGNGVATGNGGVGSAGGAGGQGGQGGQGGAAQWQPGEWKSKKNQEEMARAWESVVDRDWDPRQFGDVVLKGRKQRGL